MPETVVHNVQANYVVNERPGVAALGRIASAAGRINNIFDSASKLLGDVAAVGGTAVAALSFERILDTTREHLGMVQRISDLTGTNVRSADALVETFEQVGLRGEDAERILLGMSRRSAMMNVGMMQFGRQVGGTAMLFRQLGVDVRKGPEAALIRMSSLYKEGRIDVGQIGMAFGVPRQQALNLVRLLAQGPEKLREMVKEGREFAVSDESMRQFERMRIASGVARAALTRMQVMIGSELLPVIAELMESAARRIKSWLPNVRAFAEFLRDNLQSALSTIVKIGKVMLANYAVARATAAMQAAGMLRGLGAGTGGVGIGGVARAAAGFVAGGGAGLAGIARVVMMLGRLSLLGIVITAIWVAFKAIRENALGARDILLRFWERLVVHFAVISKLFAPVAQLFTGNGVIGHFFTRVIVDTIVLLTTAVDGLMSLVETIVIFVKKAYEDPKRLLSPIDLLGDAVIEAAKMHREAMAKEQEERRARVAARKEVPAERAIPYYDFRNSRFDITQKFEEGFDPDRIALAFANDLASLGERKLQSGFAPLYAIR